MRGRDPRRGSSPPTDDLLHRDATQWGHVALFYLTNQKHRWRSFIFESLDVTIEALQTLHGENRFASLRSSVKKPDFCG